MSDLLEVRGLTKTYRRSRETIAALRGVDLTLAPGETLALVGNSGSGKTTLGRAIARLIEPDGGAIRFEGRDLLAMRGRELRAMRARLQIVFQEPLEAFNPRATVFRVIADPLRVHRLAGRAEMPEAVSRLLVRVGLEPALAARAVHEISGGQRQRVAIARAIATRPSLIVLDEPLSALDVSVRGRILALLDDLQAETGVAYLLITHDLGVANAVAGRITVIDGGSIVEEGPTKVVLADPQSAAARRLVAAVPRLHRRTEPARIGG
ncbi:MAG: ABC transporter ATP-binding protein [Bauldia sp.]|nr:ABC transporter ATP-binding protein [Bauldia sp.]